MFWDVYPLEEFLVGLKHMFSQNVNKEKKEANLFSRER